jgi:hypothetical protein
MRRQPLIHEEVLSVLQALKIIVNSSIFRRVLGDSYFITIFTLLFILFSQEISFR